MNSTTGLSLLLFAGSLALPGALASQGVSPQDAAKNPKELGRVTWLRDFDAAMKRSRKTGKPIFLQFQEVPG